MRRTNIKEIITNHFFTNPTTKIRARQLERATKTTLPSVLRYLKELQEEHLIKKTSIAGVDMYEANRSTQQYKLEKTLHNIKQLHWTGVVQTLIKHYHNPTIILFGSYSKGEDTEESDIDFYIETPATTTPKLSEEEKELNRKIQLHKHKSIHDIPNKDLANNIINGIQLNGYLEVL